MVATRRPQKDRTVALRRETLPKDCDQIMQRGDFAEQIAVFDSGEVDAHNEYDTRTAPSFWHGERGLKASGR